MPRRSEGARLYLYERPGREAVYIIRDGSYQRSTGCGRFDRGGAEEELQQYLEKKHRPGGSSAPSEVPIADVLSLYAQNVAPLAKRPDVLLYTVETLLQWWGKRSVADVKGATCRAYSKWRAGQPWRHAKTSTRTVGEATVRRELESLRAAIRHYHAEHTLDAVPVVSLPPPAQKRERWLTRSEVARMVWAAWRNPKAKHLARFILIAVYTGTRHTAILRLAWLPTPTGGWVDLDKEVMHRRGVGEGETKKRRPPIRIPRRLLVHLRRWHATDMRLLAKKREKDPAFPPITHIIHHYGQPILKERRAWRTACEAAGLGMDVVPHVGRHTAATWLMQRGTALWEAAGYLGMTVEMLEQTYGHHHPDFQAKIRDVF